MKPKRIKARLRHICQANSRVVILCKAKDLLFHLVPNLGTCYRELVRIVSRNTLVQVAKAFEGHQDHHALKASLDAWYHEVKRASWKNSSDVKASFAHASIVSADRVVFNIRGNNYRLVAHIDYRRSAVFIKWFGTHKDYDAVDVRTVQHAPKTS